MNHKLLKALQSGDHDSILRLLAESGVAESEVADMLNEEDNAKAIAESVKVACAYILQGIGTVNKDATDWNTLFNTARIQVGLDDLRENPATPVFVQAMMLIAYALLKGD